MASSFDLKSGYQYSQEDSQAAADTMNISRTKGLFCDLKIRTSDGVDFPVHKCVLAAWSGYFEALLMRWKDSGILEEATVLDGVTSEDLGPVLSFIYGQKIKFTSVKNLQRMIFVADYLQIPSLMICAIQYMTTTLDVSNCYDYYLIAELYHVHDPFKSRHPNQLLSKKIARFIESNIGLLKADSDFDFRKLPKVAFVEYLKKYELGCYSFKNCSEEFNVLEIDVYHKICNWLLECDSRQQFTEELMALVRFSLIGTKDIQKIVLGEGQGICLNDTVKEQIADALKYKNADMAYKLAHHSSEVDCRNKEYLLIFGGTEGLAWSNKSLVLNPRPYNSCSGNLTSMPDINLNSRQPSVATLRGFVMIAGGWESDNIISKSLQCFDPRGWSSELLAPMNFPRVEFPLVVAGKLYAIAGLTLSAQDGKPEKCTGTIESFDPDINQWKMEPVSISPVKKHSAVECSNIIYIYGGLNCQGQFENQVKYYNPGSQTMCILNGPLLSMFSPHPTDEIRMFYLHADALLVLINMEDDTADCRFITYDLCRRCWDEFPGFDDDINRLKGTTSYVNSDKIGTYVFMGNPDHGQFIIDTASMTVLSDCEFYRNSKLVGWSNQLLTFVKVPVHLICEENCTVSEKLNY